MLYIDYQIRGWPTFSENSQVVNTSDCVDHTVFVTTAQLCRCGSEVPRDSPEGMLVAAFKWAQFGPLGSSLPAFDLNEFP